MDTKIVLIVIVFIILISYQYTLNKILKELCELKQVLKQILSDNSK